MFSLKTSPIYIHIYPHKPKQFRRQTARPCFVITETERLVYELNKTCLQNLHEKIQLGKKKSPGSQVD